MNNRAAICRMVVDEKSVDMSAMADELGLTERVAITLVGQLCGEGVLRRNGSHVLIANEARARVIAESDPMNGKPAAPSEPEAPRFAPTVQPKKAKIPDEALQTQVTIDKGVPIPEKWSRTPFKCLWPFASMEIGDSFATTVPDGVDAQVLAERLRKDAASWDRIHPPFRAAVRVIDQKTVRVWRTAVTVRGKKTEATTAAPVPPIGNGSGIRVRGRKAA